jgi:glycerol-3-phosphate acyltransferase PlsX
LTATIISIDAMGGDHGPEVTVPALALALDAHPNVEFLIYGDQAAIGPYLHKFKKLKAVSTVVHCEMSIAMDAKPSNALRQGRKVSGMWQSIDAVKSDAAHACVSAGNTGALMAMAKIILRTLPGIERPAIACMWPTLRGESVVLDVGANIGGTGSQYSQFAVMGVAYAKTVFGLQNPTVALLNIGVEDVKGTDGVKDAASLLSQSDLNFTGFIEGDGIGQGEADVVVTDGFTGNIALKTAEGTARQIGGYLRQAMSSSWMSKIGYLFSSSAFATLRARMDPNAANGGMFLGLNGIVVKSHGGADIDGFATAVGVAIDVAEANMLETIAHDIEKMQSLLDDAWAGTLT